MQQVVRTTLVVLGIVALVYLLYLVGELFLVLFFAIVFASTIRPIVEKLASWRLPRGIAATLVTLVVIAVFLGLLVVVTPPLVGMTVELFEGETLMEEIERLASWLTFFGWDQFRIVLPTVSLPFQVQRLLDLAGDTAREQAGPLAGGAVLTITQVILMFVFGIYWLVSRGPALDLFLRLIPHSQRAKAEDVWTEVETALGAYTRGQLTLMVAVGLASLVGLVIFRVPYAPALALIAGLTEVIPVVGPILGAIPAALLGLTVSWQTALLIGGWYLLVQQLEAHLLVPRVMHRAVGLNPILVILALSAGAIVKGVVGALIAVPMLAALQVLVRRLWIEPAIDKHDHDHEVTILVPGEEPDVAATVVE